MNSGESIGTVGDLIVLLRRLDALKRAIDSATRVATLVGHSQAPLDWIAGELEEIMWHYDKVRSTADKMAGVGQ